MSVKEEEFQGPQRLSLLELVLESSASMLWSVMVHWGLPGVCEACIHGWSRICSNVGRSDGRCERHHSISCWHSGKGGQM